MVSSAAECECVIQQTPEASKYWSGTGIVQGDLTVLVFTPVNRKGACVRTGYASKAQQELRVTICRQPSNVTGRIFKGLCC